jgi:phenylalanyl-tRNA synthetase beta chain
MPREELMIGLTSERDFYAVKGAIQALLGVLNPRAELEATPLDNEQLKSARSCELWIVQSPNAPQLLGYLGEINPDGLRRFDLRASTTVAELKFAALSAMVDLVPQYTKQAAYPAVERDLNLVVDEEVRWGDLAKAVREAASPFAERLEYRELYRDAERLGPGKKSLLMTLTLRSHDQTLTNDEADRIRDRIVAACQARFGAQLRA